MGSTQFTYLKAGGPVPAGSTSPGYDFIGFTSLYTNASLRYSGYKVSFYHDGAALEIPLVCLPSQANGAVLLKVDNQYVTTTVTTLSNNGTTYYLYVNFGTVQKRRIDLYVQSVAFGGVRTGQTDSIVPAEVRGPRTIFVGDSYTYGAGANTQSNSYVDVFADALGWDDVWQQGVTSTGYLNPGTGSLPYRQRFPTDVYPWNPEVIFLTGGINDLSYSIPSVIAEAANCVAALQQNCPGAMIVMCAPFHHIGASGLPLTVWQLKAGLKAIAAANNLLFLDMLELPLPSWVTPQSSTLTSSPAAGATSFTVSQQLIQRATYQFPDGSRFACRAINGSAGAFTITPDFGLQTAQTSGGLITQVGDCFWYGNGNTGNLQGFGNCDVYVTTDNLHPSPAGHLAIGQTLADLFLQAIGPN